MGNPIARAKKVTGSWPAASLLLRIQYWMEKTKIERFGFKWVVMSREAWQEETGCTLSEYKNALSLLVSLNIITAARHKHYGKVATFIRLNDTSDWRSRTPTGWCSRTPINWRSRTPILYKNTSYSIVRYRSEILEVSSEKFLAGKNWYQKLEEKQMLKFKKPVPRNSLPEGEELPQSPLKTPKAVKPSTKPVFKGLTAASAVSVLQAKKTIVTPTTDKPSDLGTLWKRTLAEECDIPFIKLTQKQLGMLKHFAAKCPAGEAGKVMKWAILNWITFVKRAEQEAAAFKTPASPKIEFLLQHAWIAVKLALHVEAPEPKVEHVSKPLPVPVQEVAKPLKSDQPQSLEELLAIFSMPAKEG